MVIVRLNGGLGNQLFQYAAGYSIATKKNDYLKIDVEGFKCNNAKNQIYRNLDINDFSITASIASFEEVQKARNPFGYFSKVYRFLKQKIFKCYYVDWHPELLNASGDIYLDGYFQTDKYFASQFELICKEFRLKPDLYSQILDVVQQIQSKTLSVSIHIRRGDYAQNPKTRKYHLVCDVDYYQRAISFFSEKFSSFHLFVFSDDPAWVRENLSLPSSTTFISSDPSETESFKPSQEIVLMSKCRHHIISNSSFSWWGAYLNKSSEKIVLAPSIWNKGPIAQPNILPSDWIIVQVGSMN